MDEGGLDYDSCLPQDLKDIIPIVPLIKQKQRGSCFWKGGSGRVLRALTEKSIQLRERESRVATQCYHQWDSACLCVQGKETVAGVLLGSAHSGV